MRARRCGSDKKSECCPTGSTRGRLLGHVGAVRGQSLCATRRVLYRLDSRLGRPSVLLLQRSNFNGPSSAIRRRTPSQGGGDEDDDRPENDTFLVHGPSVRKGARYR